VMSLWLCRARSGPRLALSMYIGVVNDDVANAREDAKFTVAVRTAQ
jgi:hypothetical protein